MACPLGGTGERHAIDRLRQPSVRSFFGLSVAEDANAASITGLRHVPLATSSSRYQLAWVFERRMTAALGPEPNFAAVRVGAIWGRADAA
jgi:hypothetical protein